MNKDNELNKNKSYFKSSEQRTSIQIFHDIFQPKISSETDSKVQYDLKEFDWKV